MLAAVLALGASVAWGIADFLGGIKSRVVPTLVVILLAQPVGFLGIGLLVAVAGNAPPGREVLWAVPAALCGTLGIAAFYRGMAVGSISIIAPIVAVAAVVPVAFGVATGDEVSPAQWVGFVLALGGAALASVELDADGGQTRVAAGIGWALAAIVGFGGYYVPMHEASERDFLWATWIFRGSVALLAVAAWIALRPPLAPARGHLLAIAVIGILDSAGNAFFAAASSEGEVSVVSVLATLYPVVTVALAAAVLGERVQRVQRVGIVAALLGVALISGG